MDHNCTPSKKETTMGRFWDFFFHASKLYNKYTHRANCSHCGKRIVAPKSKLSTKLQDVMYLFIMIFVGAFVAGVMSIIHDRLPLGIIGLTIQFSAWAICALLFFVIKRSILAVRLARKEWKMDDITIDVSGSYVDEKKALLDEKQLLYYCSLILVYGWFHRLFIEFL